jgi:hypothetical protein
MQGMVNADAATRFLQRCLQGDEGARVFIEALKYATDRAYGKAQQHVDLSGKVDTGGVLLVPVMDAETWAAEAATQQAGHGEPKGDG